MKHTRHLLTIALSIACIGLSHAAYAQENLSYQTPPKSILDLADAVRAPSVQIDSKMDYMLLSYRNTFKTLAELNQSELRLAGLRINPVTNISSSMTYINNLKLRKVNDDKEIAIKDLPKNPLIANISWSPDEKKIAFTNTTDKGVELWLIDVVGAKAKKLSAANLNANLGSPFMWFKDSESLLLKVLPKSRPALLDASKDLPTGPITSNSSGTASQNRT